MSQMKLIAILLVLAVATAGHAAMPKPQHSKRPDEVALTNPNPTPEDLARAMGHTPDELAAALAVGHDPLVEAKPEGTPPEQEDPKSVGCVSCHNGVTDMHAAKKVGCTDCHGGNAAVVRNLGSVPGSQSYEDAKKAAHVQPKHPDWWPTSANPERTYTKILRETREFIKFINPGDLRVSKETCGTSKCHADYHWNVKSSMMNHGSSLWAAVLYNNGSIPHKRARYGEVYGEDGKAQRVMTVPPPTEEESWWNGVLPFLDPLPHWAITQPGNILRVFERGAKRKLEVGLPDVDEDPGKPDKGLSPRGLGTLNRTDPVFLGIQKTRLLDPLLSMLGTNDHPGDYRSSGCSGCHVMYANDRDPVHSAYLAQYGNRGKSFSVDPTIPKNESGHPVRHRFTTAIPSSQCVSCHMHPGTNMANGYLGSIWWDNETDGEQLYLKKEWKRTEQEKMDQLWKNPESANLKGKWADPDFLANMTTEVNPKAKDTQFNDYHGHGWLYRKIFKRDRKGNLIDKDGQPIKATDTEKWSKAVHLKDIHLEKGMHCIDCHFSQDNHGNGKLYGEVRNMIEIQCADCHGDNRTKAQMVTTGFGRPEGGTAMNLMRTPFGEKRFEWRGDELVQRSSVIKGLEWKVVQVADTLDPAHKHYNVKSRLAKTIRKDGKHWGDASRPDVELAHSNQKMTCFACHTAWMTSCFGCHLPMKANNKKPMLHNEGTHDSRNWTTYNFQVIRDDVFMLGVDGTATGNKIAPVRSSTAVLVSSQNQNREWIYSQQQTISAGGYSGQAMNTHVPHSVRGKNDTKMCTDCHISQKNDNNAWMAQLLLQGTNFVNFIGRYLYVGEGHHGFEAVVVAERDEPQAVIGSHLHKLAYPDRYEKHLHHHQQLHEEFEHKSMGEVLALQHRGEYLYTANGERGFEVFDIAQIDHKGFSERMVTAPVSPWGQRTWVKTRYATHFTAPSTLAVDPTREVHPENMEQPHKLIWAFVYVTDRYEGLVLVNVATLLDGNPMNNFIKRALTFNPEGRLNGARHVQMAGNHLYILTPREMVVVSIEDPLKPKIVGAIGKEFLDDPRAVAIQFRYAFVTDKYGLKVIDVTFPDAPKPVYGSSLPLGSDCTNIYVARTYAYIAAGWKGVAIVDVENPEKPKLYWQFNGDGILRDTKDVKVASTNACAFMYVADGENGVHIFQITDPSRASGHLGFSPAPIPKRISWFQTRGPAIALSKGLDRDRGVDESGNQVVVFGRIGARPLNLAEQQKMYIRDGKVFTVTNDPPGPPDAHKPTFSPVKTEEVESPSGNMILRLKFD